MKKGITPVFAVLGAVAIAGLLFSSSPGRATSSVSSSLYWGVYIDGVPWDMTKLAAFEAKTLKKVSIVHWAQPWKSGTSFQSFQTSAFSAVRTHGSIPMLTWGSQKNGVGVSQSAFQNRDIYGGTYDWFIRKWALAAKAWGHPFFLRFDWEMNGWWYPWGEGKSGGTIVNGNRPGDFVTMWRHVHDVFKSVGATNVTWVWCPNIMSTSTSYPSLSQVYPGDAYVDWTCLDGYNKTSTWMNFQGLFQGKGYSWMRNSYQLVLNVAPNKPMMLGETASNEAGDGGTKKGQWHRYGLGTELPSYMPKVKAYVYFNWNGGSTTKSYPVDTTKASVSGFQDGIGSLRYLANAFGSISVSPIPAR